MTPPLDAAGVARRMLEARDRGATAVTALVVEGPGRGRRRLLVVEEDGGEQRWGVLADPALESAVDALLTDTARAADTPAHRTVRIGGVEARVYLERMAPPPGLLIVGAGHIAEPLHRLGALLGFHVTVADDRPDFAELRRFPHAERVVRVDFAEPFAGIEPRHRTHVVLVTRGHRFDYECLRLLLREPRPPVYIGMIGSRRRVRATYHQLLDEGFSAGELRSVRAPVGLDLGAETPAEIAVAVAAEWVALARGGTGRPLVEVERIADRFFGTEAVDAG